MRGAATGSTLGGAGAGGLAWAMSYFDWQVPQPVAIGILVLSGVLLLIAVILWSRAGIDWWRRRGASVEPSHLIIIGLVGVLVFATVALGGVLWQQYRPAVASTPAASYVETRIRLSREEGSETNFKHDERTNIYNWQQVYVRRKLTIGGTEYVTHIDTFSFWFDKPIKYGRPVINSYGHQFPTYNWHATSDRGAVLQVDETIIAPMFEIYFPPVDTVERAKPAEETVDQTEPLTQIDAKGDQWVRFDLDMYRYQDFKIIGEDFVPESKGIELLFHLGDGVSFWSAGYSNFPLNKKKKEGDQEIILAENLASNGKRPGRIEIVLYRPFASGTEKKISFESYVYTTDGTYSKFEGIGIFNYSLSPIKTVQIFLGAGRILSGHFSLYGERAIR